MSETVTHIIALSVMGLLVMAFVLLAWKDMLMLFIRPAPGMGRGVWRVWAVARTTVAESWAGRAWILPALWLVASLILISVVRPYDESERIPLYLRVLLMGQEWLLMVMIGVMACLSMPRERERKIVITNASKPISRLEMYLGKIVGFATMAFLLLMAMGVLSWVVLAISDHNTRGRAAEQYAIDENHYRQAVEKRQQAMATDVRSTTQRAVQEPLVQPSESLKRIASDGCLFAYNYVTVPPKTGFSIAGYINFKTDPPTRYIRGGSQQKITYTFSTDNGKKGISAPASSVLAPVGNRPFFIFRNTIGAYANPPPARVQLMVTARLVKNPLREQQRTLTIINGLAQWEPERPEELFNIEGLADRGLEQENGPVEITVQCPTAGVFLGVREAQSPDDYDVFACPVRSSAMGYPQDPHPKIVGFERRDKQQIAGPDPKERNIVAGAPQTEIATYRFRGSELSSTPLDEHGNFTVAMNLDVDKQGNFEQDTEAIVTAYNQENPQAAVTQRIRVVEKRITQVRLPGALLGTDPDLKKRGDLLIYLMCATPSHWIELNETSVRVELPQSAFAVNLFKSELVLFCEMLLLIVICVTCSLRLGWPVALLTSSVCVLLGFAWPFVADLAQASGLSALGFNQTDNATTGMRIADALVGATYQMLHMVVLAMPDFTRFDAMQFIVEQRNIPLTVVVTDLGSVVLFALPFVAVGYMLIRKQELG